MVMTNFTYKTNSCFTTGDKERVALCEMIIFYVIKKKVS